MNKKTTTLSFILYFLIVLVSCTPYSNIPRHRQWIKSSTQIEINLGPKPIDVCHKSEKKAIANSEVQSILNFSEDSQTPDSFKETKYALDVILKDNNQTSFKKNLIKTLPIKLLVTKNKQIEKTRKKAVKIEEDEPKE